MEEEGGLTGQYDQSDPDIMLGNIYQLISETGSCACTTHFGWCSVHITSKEIYLYYTIHIYTHTYIIQELSK